MSCMWERVNRKLKNFTSYSSHAPVNLSIYIQDLCKSSLFLCILLSDQDWHFLTICHRNPQDAYDKKSIFRLTGREVQTDLHLNLTTKPYHHLVSVVLNSKKYCHDESFFWVIQHKILSTCIQTFWVPVPLHKTLSTCTIT